MIKRKVVAFLKLFLLINKWKESNIYILGLDRRGYTDTEGYYHFLMKALGGKHQPCDSSSWSGAGALLKWHVKSFVIRGRWDQTSCCFCLVSVWKTSGTSALYGFSSSRTFLFSLVNTPEKWSIMNSSGTGPLQSLPFHHELVFSVPKRKKKQKKKKKKTKLK